MSDKTTQSNFRQAFTHGAPSHSNTASERAVDYGDPRAVAREALHRAVREIDRKNKKRFNRVQKLRFLIYELKSLQPTDVNELSEALGQSKSSTLDQLKKLIKLDLVGRTHFEHHTLYCINGNFNRFIEDILDNFYFGTEND
jgi:hypothetical protein